MKSINRRDLIYLIAQYAAKIDSLLTHYIAQGKYGEIIIFLIQINKYTSRLLLLEYTENYQ